MKTLYAVALTVLVAFAVGFGIYWFFGGSMGGLLDKGKQLLTPLYNAWMKIPETLRNIIQWLTTAISSGLAGFFGWTKVLAYKKLRETEQQASQTVSQMQGVKEGAQQTTGAIVEKVSSLQETVDLTKQANTKLAETNSLLGKEVETLRNQLIRARTDAETLRRENETLQYELKLERGEIRKPVA